LCRAGKKSRLCHLLSLCVGLPPCLQDGEAVVLCTDGSPERLVLLARRLNKAGEEVSLLGAWLGCRGASRRAAMLAARLHDLGLVIIDEEQRFGAAARMH
jgi:hypothetical protein